MNTLIIYSLLEDLCVNPGGGMPMVTLSGQQVADKINALECKVTTDSRE